MEGTKRKPKTQGGDVFDVALRIDEHEIVSVEEEIEGDQTYFAFKLEHIRRRSNFEFSYDEGYTFHEFEEVDPTSVEFPLESTIDFRDATTTGVYRDLTWFERITAENTERVFTPPQPSSGDDAGD